MFKGRHFHRSMILLCVRWYLAYGLLGFKAFTTAAVTLAGIEMVHMMRKR